MVYSKEISLGLILLFAFAIYSVPLILTTTGAVRYLVNRKGTSYCGVALLGPWLTAASPLGRVFSIRYLELAFYSRENFPKSVQQEAQKLGYSCMNNSV